MSQITDPTQQAASLIGTPQDPNFAADQTAISAYPQMAWALADPELGPMLRAAAASGWDSTRLRGALDKTKWYQTHDDAAQAWADLAANDPAEASQRVQAEALNVRNAANQMGVNLSPTQITNMASQVLTNGLSPAEVQNMLGGLLPTGQGNTQNQRGGAAYSIDQMTADAKNMAVPVSNGTLNSWAQQIAQGAATEDGFKAFLQKTALTMYPTLAPELQQGLTVQQAVDPIRQKIASRLDIDPNTVDFEDPKWSKFLQQVDPKTGQKSVMPLWQVDQTVMSDPSYGYQQTAAARSQGATVAQTIGRMFGATTGGTTSGI